MAFGKSHKDPFGTSMGHLIEKATFAGVQTEDWGQFMHICDMIITSKDGFISTSECGGPCCTWTTFGISDLY
uniref:Target of myb1 like 1 membrane trafficking protein n=1 Tax=Monodelphis domestica TaxID=13616 RepID=A0A5F8HCH1_MONDO